MITIKILLRSLILVLLSSLLDQIFGHNDQQLNTTSSWLKSNIKTSMIKKPLCKPWICKRSGPPMSRMRCCRNQCVDVLSDPNHCRFCFKRCRFGLSCCNGNCVDTKNDPSNCGQCGNKCDSGAPCEFGLCGYAAPSSPPGKKRRRHKGGHKPRPPPSPYSYAYDHDGEDE